MLILHRFETSCEGRESGSNSSEEESAQAEGRRVCVRTHRNLLSVRAYPSVPKVKIIIKKETVEGNGEGLVKKYHQKIQMHFGEGGSVVG